MFGLPPREPGYGLAVIDGRCYQRGIEVECEEREPVFDLPPPFSPPIPAGTGGVKCAPGFYQDNSGNCVALLPGSGGGGSQPPVLVVPPGNDRAACLAYVAKYRNVFHRDPAPLPWCMTQPAPCPTGFIRRPDGSCMSLDAPPPAILPPVHEPDSPPPPGPVHHHRRHPRRLPPVRRPHVPKPKPVTPAPVIPVGEICPTWGYVPRPIPGVDEYQNFRCTPGQPVVIDPGLQEAGRLEALRRHGLGDLEGFTVGNIEVPTWALVAGAAAVGLLLLKRRR